MNKTNRGITIIQLVVTIIVLIVLAGVAIQLTIGENGIFNKATQASEDYLEQAARERLETTLADILAEKLINSEYN